MQYIINTGNVANDGTGDPLRTAFTDVNLNFNQVWAAGPVGSNIQIANNTIQTTNINGNLILATNGTGVITAAAGIQPDVANVRSIGSSAKRFNTVYTQYVDAQSGSYTGNLYVAGNLMVTGNSINVNTSNLDIANATITLSAGAPYPALADGSGIVVDGAGAGFTYSAVNNDWESNLPISAPTFYGDGSHLTNVVAVIDGASITGNSLSDTVLTSSLTSVGILTGLSVAGNINTTGSITTGAVTSGVITGTQFVGNGSGLTGIVGSGISGVVANARYATYAGAAETANLAALATQAVNADTALFALTAGNASVAGNAVYAQWANVANTACMADIANAAVVAGFANTIGTQTTITVTGNIVVGGIKTDNYYFANGQPATFGGGGSGNYSNANVAAFLPTYSGDLLNLGNTITYGTAVFGNVQTSGNLITVGVTATSVSATGNLAGGAVYANGFFYANGIPFTGAGFVLGDQQFYGDNTVGPYTLTQSSTTNAVIVTINGLTQTPGTTYTVSGNLITFTDSVNTDEFVDIRFLGTGAGGGVSQIVAGNNITISPTNGTGVVTINSTGGTANTGNIGFNGDVIYDLNGMSLTNGDLSHGPTSQVIIPGNGNTTTPAQIINTYGNVLLTAGNGSANTTQLTFDSAGVLNLPAGRGYSYTADLVGSGSGGQVEFELTSELSGTSTQWLAGITAPGTGYASGDEFIFDAAFLRIPGASVTISVLDVDGDGGITDIGFSPPPLYPTSLYRQDGFIALQADNNRWTFGLNGNLTLPSNTSSINYANGQPYGGSVVGPDISVTGNIVADGSISANTILVGGTPFTRTLTVGRAVTPVTIPLASNNSLNILTANGSSNVVVYTT